MLDMTVREILAHNLKIFRKRCGYSVDQVGAAVGKSGKTISAWETGRGQPDADKLIELCKLFGVSISDFYGREDAVDPAYGSYKTEVYPGTVGWWPFKTEPDYGFPCPAALRRVYPNSFFIDVDSFSAGFDLSLPVDCLVLVDFDSRELDGGGIYAIFANQNKSFFIRKARRLLGGYELVPESSDATQPRFLVKEDKEYDSSRDVCVVGEVVWYTVGFDCIKQNEDVFLPDDIKRSEVRNELIGRQLDEILNGDRRVPDFDSVERALEKMFGPKGRMRAVLAEEGAA